MMGNVVLFFGTLMFVIAAAVGTFLLLHDRFTYRRSPALSRLFLVFAAAPDLHLTQGRGGAAVLEVACSWGTIQFACGSLSYRFSSGCYTDRNGKNWSWEREKPGYWACMRFSRALERVRFPMEVATTEEVNATWS